MSEWPPQELHPDAYRQLVDGAPAILYIDLHLVHEVTSPQAFDGLRDAGRKVRRPDLTVATIDHNVPTTDRSLPIADAIAIMNAKRITILFAVDNGAPVGVVHMHDLLAAGIR